MYRPASQPGMVPEGRTEAHPRVSVSKNLRYGRVRLSGIQIFIGLHPW